MSTYTEQEVQDYIERLTVDYGSASLDRYQAITHLLADNVEAAIREHVDHVCLPEAVRKTGDSLVDQSEASAP